MAGFQQRCWTVKMEIPCKVHPSINGYGRNGLLRTCKRGHFIHRNFQRPVLPPKLGKQFKKATKIQKNKGHQRNRQHYKTAQ